MPLDCWNQTMWRRKLYRYEVALQNKNIFQLLALVCFVPLNDQEEFRAMTLLSSYWGFIPRSKHSLSCQLSCGTGRRSEGQMTRCQTQSPTKGHQPPCLATACVRISPNSCLNRKSSCTTVQPSSALMCWLKTQKEMDLVRLISTIQTLNETNKQTNEL